MIPEAAVEAALAALGLGPHGYTRTMVEIALEAAAPHMLAGVISTLDEQVWRLENTLVDERDYPALCAQREALIGVIQMLSPTP